MCYCILMSLLENKKAGLEYELGEKYEAGIELHGFEVKTLREKHGSLIGSYVLVKDGQAYLLGAFIPPYQEKNAPTGFDPKRTRTLLLSKKELRTLTQEVKEKGLTLVPLSLYNKGTKIKLGFALGRGKKKYDKRETLKKKTVDRETRREHKLR